MAGPLPKSHVFRALAVVGVLAALAPAFNAAQAQTPPPQPPAARAAAAAKAAIDVGSAWTRATPGRASAAAIYLRIVNAGKEADTLNGAEVSNAARATLHASTVANGMVSMQMMPNIPVPASTTVTLAPNGRHIMLEGLKAPLRAGESFIITLVFAKAGKISTTVKVVGVAAIAPAEAAVPAGQPNPADAR